MKDTSDVPRTVVSRSAASRIKMIAAVVFLFATGVFFTVFLHSVGNLIFVPTSLQDVIWIALALTCGPGVMLLAPWWLWQAGKTRPGEAVCEIDGSGLVLHEARFLRRLDPPLVLPWTDIAVIRTRDGNGLRDLCVQSRGGAWHVVPTNLTSPDRRRAAGLMLAALAGRGIPVARSSRWLVLWTATEWRLGTS